MSFIWVRYLAALGGWSGLSVVVRFAPPRRG
jgi:hypothetical protein